MTVAETSTTGPDGAASAAAPSLPVSEDSKNKGGRPRVARCKRQHTLLRADGTPIRETDSDPRTPCPKCLEIDKKKASAGLNAKALSIPGINAESDAQRAERERVTKEAEKAAAHEKMREEAKQLAKLRMLKLSVADMLREIIGDEVAQGASDLAVRYKKPPLSKIPCKLVRANPNTTPVELEIMGEKMLIAPPAFAIKRNATVQEALATALCDGVMEVSREIPVLNHPALPAILTMIFVALAIVRSPTIEQLERAERESNAKPAPKTEDPRINVTPEART